MLHPVHQAGESIPGGAGLPFTGWYYTRGLGVAEMAKSIRFGRPHRASDDLVYHVLDVMQGSYDASRDNRHVPITSGFLKPKVLPIGLPEGELGETRCKRN